MRPIWVAFRLFTRGKRIGEQEPVPGNAHRARHGWRALLGEPTLHFLLLGGLLFVAYPLVAPAPSVPAKPEIVIGSAKVRSLVGDWTEQWQRPPLPAERAQLIEDEVRSEILVREATARWPDPHDDAIRTLLREKMELIAEQRGGDTRAGRNRAAGILSSSQTGIRRRANRDRSPRSCSTRADMAPTSTRTRQLCWRSFGRAAARSTQRRWATRPIWRASYESLPQEQVDALFGPEFAQRLASLEPGVWDGPIPSPFGLHLVRLDGSGEAPLRPLSEVHDVVREEWNMAQLQAARDQAYLALRERYRVVVEPVEPLTATLPGSAAAMRLTGGLLVWAALTLLACGVEAHPLRTGYLEITQRPVDQYQCTGPCRPRTACRAAWTWYSTSTAWRALRRSLATR